MGLSFLSGRIDDVFHVWKIGIIFVRRKIEGRGSEHSRYLLSN